MFKRFKKLPKTITLFYKKHVVISIGLILALISLAIYTNSQAFLNLWLTRDQQAMVSFNQGDTAKAARTFEDKNWVAYSFYADGDFEQAATIYSQFEGNDAKFAQANAAAHASQFLQAAELYQELLDVDPQYQYAQENLTLINELIKKMKKSPGKKALSNEMSLGKRVSDTKLKNPNAKGIIVSNDLWLKQVQQNPSKFLRKKFQQEYINAEK